jgi:hypothetical protein
MPLLLLLCCTIGCVQKTYKKTLVCYLDVSDVAQIKTVGIRGEGRPLSWKEDIPMVPVVKDSLYSVAVSGETPYTFVEIKFTVNGEFELANQENRRIAFSHGDTTFYKAIFNKRK